MADVMICVQSGEVTVDGRTEWVRRDRTVAHADHPVVVEHPELWRKIEINYPTPTPATAPDRVPTPTAEPTAPAPKDVRAWAKATGLDVPGRGPLSDEIVAQYKAAQG